MLTLVEQSFTSVRLRSLWSVSLYLFMSFIPVSLRFFRCPLHGVTLSLSVCVCVCVCVCVISLVWLCSCVWFWCWLYICVCLMQTELELQRMKEREDETERRRDEHLLPSMQSCSTQTEQVVVNNTVSLLPHLKKSSSTVYSHSRDLVLKIRRNYYININKCINF